MKLVRTVGGDTGDPAPYWEALRQVDIAAEFGKTLAGVGGLVLLGGTDVNPARYGEAAQEKTEAPDDARDELECSLIAEALERDLPILGICRGMQILNVQHGGTLIQHVEGHQQKTADKSISSHAVDLIPGTGLSDIAGGFASWRVNSRHHQAVGRVGAGLVVSARHADGIIEAIERQDKRFVVAVQWHPENQIANADGSARKLFEAFRAALG